MSAPELDEVELAIVERFDMAPDAPESFDATAALRRVLNKCDALDAWLKTEIVTDNGFAEQVGATCVDEIRAAVEGQ